MAIEVERHGGVAHAIFDDPPLNILTRALLGELRAVLSDLAGEPTLRVLLVSARGKHFSAGASVEEHLPGSVEAMIPEFMETVRTVDAFPVPVVFAVHGRCLGGALELVLAGDIVVAAEGALFGVPEIQLGVLPPAACVQLSRISPSGVAAELVYTGASIDAEAARRAGLVLRVVPPEALLAEAGALADSIAERSAATLRVAKRALRAGRGDLDARMVEVERLYLGELMATADATEGLASFLEKRPPRWSHA
jgi:cyclohexa-1,5-dienecarbonyl-CoA hydratase